MPSVDQALKPLAKNKRGDSAATRPFPRDGGILQRPNSRTTHQGLNQRSKMEETVQRWCVAKLAM